MKTNKVNSLINKHLLILIVIYTAIFLATIIGKLVENYINFYGTYNILFALDTFLTINILNIIKTAAKTGLLFFILIYVIFIFWTMVKQFKPFRYNLLFILLSTFIAILTPAIEGALANKIGSFFAAQFSRVSGAAGEAWGYSIFFLSYPIFLALKLGIIMLVLTWIFNKGRKNVKSK